MTTLFVTCESLFHHHGALHSMRNEWTIPMSLSILIFFDSTKDYMIKVSHNPLLLLSSSSSA